MKIYRHGDILLKEIENLPKNLKPLNHGILAEGEFTGHKHELKPVKVATKPSFQIYQDEKGETYVEILEPSEITHQEHKTLRIEKGIYYIQHEREYNPFEKKIEEVRD